LIVGGGIVRRRLGERRRQLWPTRREPRGGLGRRGLRDPRLIRDPAPDRQRLVEQALGLGEMAAVERGLPQILEKTSLVRRQMGPARDRQALAKVSDRAVALTQLPRRDPDV